jgi:hypothetical protein
MTMVSGKGLGWMRGSGQKDSPVPATSVQLVSRSVQLVQLELVSPLALQLFAGSNLG